MAKRKPVTVPEKKVNPSPKAELLQTAQKLHADHYAQWGYQSRELLVEYVKNTPGLAMTKHGFIHAVMIVPVAKPVKTEKAPVPVIKPVAATKKSAKASSSAVPSATSKPVVKKVEKAAPVAKKVPVPVAKPVAVKGKKSPKVSSSVVQSATPKPVARKVAKVVPVTEKTAVSPSSRKKAK